MKKMNKLFAVCGAAIMMMAVPAFAGETDLTGEWYGDMMGAVMKMSINEDGTYSVGFNDDLSEGTWELTDEGIMMDGEEILTVTEDGLVFSGPDGIEVTFGREELENFAPAEIDYEADLDLLQGTWSAYKIGADGAYVNIAPADESYMEMEIDGTTVTLDGALFGEPLSIDMDNQDGGLFTHFDDEGEMFELIAVNYLEDGTLRLALVASLENDEQVEYFFVPLEALEDTTEEIAE